MSKKPYIIKLVKTVFCCSLFTIHFSLVAQQRMIDSLRNVLKTEKDDTNKVNTLNILCEKLWRTGKYDTSMVCSKSTKILAEKLEYKKGIATAYNNLGVDYYCLGNYPQALECDQKAIALYQEIGNKNGVANNYGNIGVIYDQQGNYPKALEYYKKALALDQEMGDKNGIATDLCNIGVVYQDQGNYPQALDYFEKALAIYQEIKNAYGIAANLGNIGDVYDLQGNYLKALEYDYKSLPIFREIGDEKDFAVNLANIGCIYVKQKEFKQAKVYLDSSLSLSKNMQDKANLRDAYKGLALFDSATGNYKIALEDCKNYIAYRDSLINEANTKKTVQAEMNFEFEQKQAAEKAEQDKKDAVAEQERNKQSVIRNSFMTGFVLMLALAFFIFRGYREKQKANIIISEQKTVVEEKQKEILDSIHYAQRIQKAILASDALLSKNLPEYFVLYKPKDIVSGDFYWATKKGEAFYLAVCDSTGHGVPGAFMSLLNISFLNEAITEKNIAQPNEVFNHARKRLIENISQDGGQDGMDGVLLCPRGTTLSYAAAYNSPLIIRNNAVIELSADKMPVGASPRENVSFTHQTTELQKGDILYVFTDGFADQFGGEKGKKFSYKQLQQLIMNNCQLTMKEQKTILEETFGKWKGELEQVDDVLIIGIRI